MSAAADGLPLDAPQLTALSEAFLVGGPYLLGLLLLGMAYAIYRSKSPPEWPLVVGCSGFAVVVLLWALVDWQDTRARVVKLENDARDRIATLESDARDRATRSGAEAERRASEILSAAGEDARKMRDEASLDAARQRTEADTFAARQRANATAEARQMREAAETELQAARARAARIIAEANRAVQQQYVTRIPIRYSSAMALRDVQIPSHLEQDYSVFWRARPQAEELTIVITGRFPVSFDIIEFLYLYVEHGEDLSQRRVTPLPFCLEVLSRAHMIELIRQRVPGEEGQYAPRLLGRRGSQELDGRCG